MRYKRVCLLVAVALISLSAAAQEGVWLPRYSPDNSGVSPASIKLPASLRWKYTIADADNAEAVAMPAVGADTVYVPLGPVMYALDRSSGALRWQQEVGAEIYSSPALSDDTLYFGSRDGNLWALDAESGSVDWRYPMGAPVDCAPVIVAGVAYFGSDSNRLVALDLETRQPLWQFETAGDIKATPLIYRDVIIVGSQDRHIYCLDHQGRQKWSKTVAERAFFAAPTGERKKVIYGCGKEVIARDIYTGRRLWRFKTAGIVTGAPCVEGRMIYVGTQGGAVYGINAGNGRALWKYPPEGVTDPISSSPVVVGNLIVFRAGARQVIAISLQGEHEWSYTLPPAPEKKKEAAPAAGGHEMVPGGDMPLEPGAMEEMPGAMPGEPPAEAGGGPGAAQPQIPAGEEAGPGGQPTTRQVTQRTYKFEDDVDSAVAVSDNTLYVLGDDAIVYALDTYAADNVPPTIAEPLLEVPGKGRVRMTFAPNLADEDDFPDRYADEVAVPGTPPIFVSVICTDEGSGINPDKVKVTLNGQEAEFRYDAKAGILWYMYDPRGAAANLPNGVTRLLFEATDWRGNRAAKVVSFTVDNKLPPPAPPKPKQPQGMQGEPGMGMEGMEAMPPEEVPPGEPPR